MSLWEEKGFCGKLTLCGEPSGVGVTYQTTILFWGRKVRREQDNQFSSPLYAPVAELA